VTGNSFSVAPVRTSLQAPPTGTLVPADGIQVYHSQLLPACLLKDLHPSSIKKWSDCDSKVQLG
jgi:hypothetical protein